MGVTDRLMPTSGNTPQLLAFKGSQVFSVSMSSVAQDGAPHDGLAKTVAVTGHVMLPMTDPQPHAPQIAGCTVIVPVPPCNTGWPMGHWGGLEFVLW